MAGGVNFDRIDISLMRFFSVEEFMNNKIGKLRATKPVKDFELGVWCSRIVNDEFENTDVIADVYGEDENEAIATAVLMAGAPALLEALKKADDLIYDFMFRRSARARTADKEIVSELRNALKFAKGE